MKLTSLLFNLLTGLTALPAVTASAEVFDKEGYDVRLLAAHFDNQIVKVGRDADSLVRPEDCRENSRRPQWHSGHHIYDSVSLDCAEAAGAALGKPVVNRYRVYLNVRPGTLDIIGDARTSARLVNIYTVTRKEAFQHAEGIGFFFESDNSFVARDRLSVFADATMQHTGEAAVIHQFAALVDGGIFEGIAFKPFMQFSANGDTWRVWEDLSSRSQLPGYEPGIWGSGNYTLKAFRHDSVVLTDVINENDLIKFDPLLPVIGQVRTDYRKTDIVTVSMYPGRRAYEVALFPYVSTTPLYLQDDNAFVVAGTRLWVRFSDQIASGRDVAMYYRLNEGDVQEAGNYLGGNCYGFKECFKVQLPAGESGVIAYWFTLTGADGQTEVYRNGDADFQTEVRREAQATVEVSPTDVSVSGDIGPDGSISIKYDPRRAIDLIRKQGRLADSLAIEAVVTSDAGQTRIPLGLVRSFRNQDYSIDYIADMALLPVVAVTGSGVEISVKISSRVSGIPDGDFVDSLGAVTLP